MARLLYFSADDGLGGPEVFRLLSDGTAEALTNYTGFLSPSIRGPFVELNGLTYFIAQSPDFVDRINRINEVGEFEQVLTADSTIDFSGFPPETAEFNGALYYTSAQGINRLDVNGTSSLASPFSSAPTDVVLFNNALYFAAPSAGQGTALHRLNIDGSTELVSGAELSGPSDMFAFGGDLYFNAITSAAGRELHRLNTDGSIELVADLFAGQGGSITNLPEREFVEFNDAVYFSAAASGVGFELHRLNSDGTAELVSDINSGAYSSNPDSFTAVGDVMYFSAARPTGGDDLFRITSNGTLQSISDLNPGVTISAPNNFVDFNGALYLTFARPGESQTLHKVNADGSVVQILGDNSAAFSLVGDHIVFDNALYFSALNDLAAGVELYRLNSDGTTELAADVNAGAGSSTPGNFFVIDIPTLFLGTSGDDILLGTADDDTFIANAGNDNFNGNAGVDIVSYVGAAAGVTAYVGFGATNDGDGGTDVFSNLESLKGSNFDDFLYGDDGNNTLFGLAGNDLIFGGAGLDVMQGGAGNDVYFVDETGDVIVENANEGIDTVYVSAASYTLGNHVETAANLQTHVSANLTGNAQDNILILSSVAGGNSVFGGAGNDIIYVQSNTVVFGDSGNDVLVLQGYGNYAEGNAGDDVYIDQGTATTIVEHANAGRDTLYTYAQDVTLGDNIEIVMLMNAGVGVNATGNNIANIIIGTEQANVLAGLDGDDFIFAGGGDDAIIGGAGSDILEGGAGADSFFFNEASEGGDLIRDWAAADDSFVFNSGAFGFAAGSALIDGTNFISGIDPASMSAQPTFLWDSDDTNLYYDADGSGAGERVLIADLQAFADVTVADFVFI